MSRSSSPECYPQPIPVITGDQIVTRPGDPNRLLLVKEFGSDEYYLPGGIYLPDRYGSPFEAGRSRLDAKVQGLTYCGDFRRFAAIAQKGRDLRYFNGMNTDHCLTFVQTAAAYGIPKPNGEIVEARFFHASELPNIKIGRGHLPIVDEWLTAVAMRDFDFRYVRHEGEVPQNMQPIDVNSCAAYPQRIPIITSTWLCHRWDSPYHLLICTMQNGKKVLPGGIFEWGRHRDPLATGNAELEEESGHKPLGHLSLFAIDLRHKGDQRQWCSLQTEHCVDHIMVAAGRGSHKIQDVQEMKRADFIDVRDFDIESLDRGHGRLVREWIHAQMEGGKIAFRWIED